MLYFPRCVCVRFFPLGEGGFYQVKAHIRNMLFGYRMRTMTRTLELGAFTFAGTSEAYLTAQGSFSIRMPAGASQEYDPTPKPPVTEINVIQDVLPPELDMTNAPFTTGVDER